MKSNVGKLETELCTCGIAPWMKRLRETVLDTLFRENDRTDEFLSIETMKWSNLLLVRPSIHPRAPRGFSMPRDSSRLVFRGNVTALHGCVFLSKSAPQTTSFFISTKFINNTGPVGFNNWLIRVCGVATLHLVGISHLWLRRNRAFKPLRCGKKNWKKIILFFGHLSSANLGQNHVWRL